MPEPDTPAEETLQVRPSERVGPIVFSDETARGQLLEGRVVTFRPDRRTVGDTHARWSRTGKKKADVVVREAAQVEIDDDEAFLECRPLSGFESVEDWREAIAGLHGGLPDDGYLYDVVLLDTEDGVERNGDLGYDSAGEWTCECGEEFVVTEKHRVLNMAMSCPDHGGLGS